MLYDCFSASQNAAIPAGSGQLSPNANRNYYEKACVDSKGLKILTFHSQG